MILKELADLYYRLLEDPDVALPRRGFSLQNVTFCLTLDADGKLLRIDDISVMETLPEKAKRQPKRRAQKRLLPGSGKSSGPGLNPCFLWDNSGYLLGYRGDGNEAHEARARESFAALRDKHLSVESRVNHPRFSAVCRFLEQWDPSLAAEKIPSDILLTGNGVFRIQGEYVHENPEIETWWKQTGHALWSGQTEETVERGMCLVTGDEADLAQLHEPAIKGVRYAKVSGAKLVSFNCPSFVSYGKEQSLNAPVGKETVFAYCNALNYLLGNPQYKLQIGDDTTVFWTDAPSEKREETNAFLMAMLNPPAVFDDNLNKQIRHVLEQLAQGRDTHDTLENATTRFFFLGLEANSSRLSVSFWHEATLGSLLHAVHRHACDLSIQRQWTEENSSKPEPRLLSPYALLKETVRDSKDIPKPFVGSLMRSILLELPYPDAMAAAILLRIRLDHSINYARCAFLKAWLARKPKQSYQVTTMLDENNKEPGYLAGRLFAVYEKTQMDANKGRDINATIRDRYYSSASASPRGILPVLQRLYNHHLAKLEQGAKVNREKLVGQIANGIDAKSYPAHLNLEQQALFALGYYHQMRTFFEKHA